MMQPMIRTNNLSRSFQTIQAVSQLNLEIPAGIVFGVLGPNGSGKTTTIRLLLGLLEPTQGSAEVFGFDSSKQGAEIRERTGALLEHTGLYERLTAYDNLEFYGKIYHIPTSKRHARIEELLKHIQLWDRRNEVVGAWSRGMKQKLAVARTLLHQPELIFLDEPTAGLDPLAASALREDLEQLVKENQVTVFLTTHNLTDAERLCQQVAVIKSGQLLAVGKPDELRSKKDGMQVQIIGTGFTDKIFTYLTAHPDVIRVQSTDNTISLELRQNARIDEIIAELVMDGVRLEEVRKNKVSLEDIFLDLVEKSDANI